MTLTVTLQFHAIKYEYKIVQVYTRIKAGALETSLEDFQALSEGQTYKTKKNKSKLSVKDKQTYGGFLQYGLNMGTPKSSIYRWLFHYKPTIWGIPIYGHRQQFS